MVDFSIFNADKLRRMNEITMTTRDAQLGEFLARVLAVMDGEHDGAEPEVEATDVVEAPVEAPVEAKALPVVEKSNATTIKQLVADYNELIDALKTVGVIS